MQGVTALFGPSGCGKTTVLRCVAGLQMLPRRPSFDRWRDLAGRRRSSGRPMRGRSATCFRKRACSRIFRCAAISSTATAVPLRRGAEEAARLDDVVALLGMEGLLERSPLRLSGGERQRVAVGRALLSQPRLLLMDEPLAGLDRLSKDEILPYLEALHTALSIPILYVSHDLGRGRAPRRPSRADRGRPRRRVRALGGAAGRSGASGRASARGGGRAERDGHQLRPGIRAHDARRSTAERSSRPASTAPRERRSGCASAPPTSAWRGRTRGPARSSMCCRPAWRPPSRRMRRR